jgi:crotonobetainyl-CoA:carnitine CoA-transferase CaiB-like acyl-CoA transferase
LPTSIFDGLKVVEFAHQVAGPLAGGLLADLGATVVHVEDPRHGDPTRRMGQAKDGRHVWWTAIGRNKRSLTLDLRVAEGQEVARQLAAWADVVITNMRADTLSGWGLDWPALHAGNERLVMLQISASGIQSGRPNEPGFGKVGEARSGAMFLTGYQDGPPLAAGFSQADAVTGLMGAFAISAALTRRHDPGFQGEWIDLALFESLFRLIDWQVVFYDQLGYVPARSGNNVNAVPSAVITTACTSDGEWMLVTSGTPKSVTSIARLVGADATAYATLPQIAAGRDRLVALLNEWISAHTAAECAAAMSAAEVISSRVYSVADMVNDVLFTDRDDVITVDDAKLGPVRMHGVVPRLTQHPGAVWRTGPDLGEDTNLVLAEFLGYSHERLDQLREARVI